MSTRPRDANGTKSASPSPKRRKQEHDGDGPPTSDAGNKGPVTSPPKSPPASKSPPSRAAAARELAGWDLDGRIVVDTDPNQKHYGPNKRPFPLILKATGVSAEEAKEWIKNHQDQLDQILIKYGVIYFRGFSPASVEAFNSLVECFPYPNFEYVGGNAVRVQLAPRVFTTNEAPPSEPIPFHHELAQTPNWPFHVFFFCEVEPGKGGETSILHAQELYEELNELFPEAVQDLVEKGVRYVRVLSEDDDPTSAIGRGWKNTYKTNKKEEVEKKLKESGYEWEWLKEGNNLKTTSPVLQAIKTDDRTGKKVYHNQLVAAYTGWVDKRNDPKKAICLGDKSPIDDEFMQETVKLMERHRVNIAWKQGDLMLIDNKLAMHARMPFEKPRKVLASLAK